MLCRLVGRLGKETLGETIGPDERQDRIRFYLHEERCRHLERRQCSVFGSYLQVTLCSYMPDADARYAPIEDYAVIGDCASAALVGRDGSIDWLCWPRFDSPSIFAALLDADVGGRFQVHPIGDYSVERRYLDDTNVLETTFTTESGVLRVTDLMPVAHREAYERELWPKRELLRRVECVEGTVEAEVVCDPRVEYGTVDPPLDDRGPHGFFYNDNGAVLIVRSELPLTLSHAHGTLRGQWTLEKGDRQFLSLTYDEGNPAVLPLLGDHAQRKLARTVNYWRDWAGRCEYEGPHRDAVVRSALTLKLMTFSASGAIIAAPTTSLPEAIGGERNWDYRYCWIRDAALVLRALYELGYEEEGRAFFSWLLHATRLTAPKLHVLYDVYGNADLKERTLSHLEGYRQSPPVRVGNGAHDQLQLDTYGELISAAYEFVQREHSLGDWHARLLAELGEEVCARWREPDEGIWEVRSGRHHHTFSKVMCWVALERLIALHEEGYVDVPVERYREEAAEIRAAVEEHGYNETLDSYVATFGGDRLDASLLLLPTYGYTEATAPRMKSTFARIHEELAHNGLLYRYPPGTDDGLSSEEGAFGLCSFWDEELFARLGRVGEAREKLGETISYANDLGLFAEEIDVETGAFLGNFPQAFTHVGLINAAITIEKVSEDEPTLYKQPDSAPQ